MYTLNFCEYNRSNQDFGTIFRPRGSGDYLFLLFKSPMKVHLKDRVIIARENACILYTPGTPQHYQAVQRFRNSYLHFSSDESPAESFPLPENSIFYPENAMQIDSYISRLQQEQFSALPFREESVHALITLLVLSISPVPESAAADAYPVPGGLGHRAPLPARQSGEEPVLCVLQKFLLLYTKK